MISFINQYKGSTRSLYSNSPAIVDIQTDNLWPTTSGSGVVEADGSSNGSATATGVSANIKTSNEVSTGSSSVAGISGNVASTTGNSSGSAEALGIIASVIMGVGSSSGTATATAQSENVGNSVVVQFRAGWHTSGVRLTAGWYAPVTVDGQILISNGSGWNL